MKNKVLMAVVGVFLFIGCGSGGDTKTETNTPNTNTPGANTNTPGTNTETPGENTVATGTGTYEDSAINGVRYVCGSQTGITGDTGVDGGFRYEVGKSCLFTINGAGLTGVAAAGLSEGTVVRPNLEAARYLQSLDFDGNPDNGIEIHADVVQALAENNIVVNRGSDTEVENMVSDLRGYVSAYRGVYKTMAEAALHLDGFSITITTDSDSYRFGDTVTFDAGLSGSSAGLTYLWKEGDTTLVGSAQQLIVRNFSLGSHTVSLTVTNAEGVSFSDSITFSIGDAYNHTVNITSSNNSYSSDQNVTLTANVSGAEGTVTYQWSDGADTIGTNSSTLKKIFTAGSHTVTVLASANNLTKSDSITFTVADDDNLTVDVNEEVMP